MTTGSYDSDTARKEQLLEDHREGRPMAPYKALWAVLLLGWVVSYADRTLTGPVIAWMIQNKAGLHRRRGQPRHPRRAGRARCSSSATCSPSTRAAGWATGSGTAR